MAAGSRAAKVLDQAAFFRKIGYEPHPKQALFHDSTARFRLPNCGRRFGKSHMAARDLEPRLFQKDRVYWIVAPSYDLGEKEFRVIWNDLIVGQRLGQEKSIKKAYQKKQGNMYIEFPWNTRLEVRSADHPELLVGEALDHVIMSEAAKHREDTWEKYIRPALADKRGSADFPTTPEGHNWLYRLWMVGQDPKVTEYESWRFPSWENRFVYPLGELDPEIQLLRRTMSPENFEQEIAADFSSFAGKIYPEWDVARHVQNVPFDPMLPNYLAIDWGYTNPAAWIEFQITPDDRVHVWREHYAAYMTLSEHIHFMKTREQPYGYHLDGAFADAADPSSVEAVSVGLVGCWAFPEAKTNWREGIDLVRSFMDDRETGRSLDEFGTPELQPAFVVDFTCVNVIDEFNNYRAPNATRGRNVPEVGQKAKDHAMDAIRYGLMHKFKLGATSHLSDVYKPLSGVYGSTVEPVLESPKVGSGASLFVPHASSELSQAPSESGYFSREMVF
jgi:hypothetical protein